MERLKLKLKESDWYFKTYNMSTFVIIKDILNFHVKINKDNSYLCQIVIISLYQFFQLTVDKETFCLGMKYTINTSTVIYLGIIIVKARKTTLTFVNVPLSPLMGLSK